MKKQDVYILLREQIIKCLSYYLVVDSLIRFPRFQVQREKQPGANV